MAQQGVITLRAAIGSLMLAKKMGNCRQRYLKSLSSYLNLFARHREDAPVTDFTVMDIESWFTNRKESLSTMSSNVGRLSSLFGFCERRGWIQRNPVRQLERIRIERKAPKILTVEQVKNLMAYVVKCKPNETAFFTLSIFAGIRPEELSRIDWKAVDLDRGLVFIDAAASKVRRRRIVRLEPAAIEFMKFAESVDARLPVSRETRRRYLFHAKLLLGLTAWPQDLARHSAASYLLALHQDAPKVADGLGNSPAILGRHYKELVRPEDCLAFWALRP